MPVPSIQIFLHGGISFNTKKPLNLVSSSWLKPRKKEIKKLQRHRDQIKTWIASSDIKDKRALMDARKLIETKMEQFKVCEKETKTKTYSKEGLAREAKLDPEEAKKQEKREWCQECIDKLTTQMEAVEADIEKLLSAKKKTNKAELEVLDGNLKRHRWHIGKLEQIVRARVLTTLLTSLGHPPVGWLQKIRSHDVMLVSTSVGAESRARPRKPSNLVSAQGIYREGLSDREATCAHRQQARRAPAPSSAQTVSRCRPRTTASCHGGGLQNRPHTACSLQTSSSSPRGRASRSHGPRAHTHAPTAPASEASAPTRRAYLIGVPAECSASGSAISVSSNERLGVRGSASDSAT